MPKIKIVCTEEQKKNLLRSSLCAGLNECPNMTCTKCKEENFDWEIITEIKPCPFCGNTVRLAQACSNGLNGYTLVGHDVECFFNNSKTFGLSDKRLINLWTRRS